MATRESLSEHTDMSEISAEWDILIYVSVEQDGRETNHMSGHIQSCTIHLSTCIERSTQDSAWKTANMCTGMYLP